MAQRMGDGRAATWCTVQRVDALIGNSPMVKLRHIGDPDGASIWLKLEQLNPSGSIRDRYIAEILHRALEAGQMVPGDQVAIAGLDDSAVSVALLGGQLGVKVRVFAPRGASRRLLLLIQRFGATVQWTDPDAGIRGAVKEAAAWARAEADRFYIEGFRRQAVRDAYAAISIEILQALAGQPLGAFISSVSTGGTFREVSKHLRETHPTLTVAGAVLLEVDLATLGAQPGDILRRISMEEAWAMRDQIARSEGLILSPKGAACVILALELQAKLAPEQHIVAINPDAGQRYLGWEGREVFSTQNPAHLDVASSR